jgi:hypothetical protein
VFWERLGDFLQLKVVFTTSNPKMNISDDFETF